MNDEQNTKTLMVDDIYKAFALNGFKVSKTQCVISGVGPSSKVRYNSFFLVEISQT